MAEFDVAEVRQRLEAERAELLGSLERSVDPRPRTDSNPDRSDLADDMVDRERLRALRVNAEKLLAQVDAALQRLDEGTYGLCADCGQPIAAARLEFLPYATLCVRCQELLERR